MLPKPPECLGCPFYQTGMGFVPDEVHEDAEIDIYGQNPGPDEEAEGKPFVGMTGREMERVYLKLAGLNREKVTIRNAIRCRWQGRNDLPPVHETIVRQAMSHCRVHHKEPSARLTVAQGGYSLWVLTGESTPTEWRGWLMDPVTRQHERTIWTPDPGDPVVLSTLHLAALYRDITMTLPTMMDWSKIPRILAGTWPSSLPSWEHKPLVHLAPEFVFDSEYGPDGTLIRYSTFSPDRLIVTEGWMHEKSQGWVWQGKPRLIFQNLMADVGHVQKLIQEPLVWEAFDMEDTMLAHSVLYSDLPHDLDFLGSCYAPTNRWKHLAFDEPELYSAADAYNPWFIWKALKGEFARDPLSEKLYRETVLPLAPVILKSMQIGIRVNQSRAKEVEGLLQEKVREARLRAEVVAGWPINLGSNPQVGHHIYELDKWPQRLRRGYAGHDAGGQGVGRSAMVRKGLEKKTGE